MTLLEDTIKLTLSLYNNHNIPRNAVDDIVNEFDNYISQSYIPHLQQKIAAQLDDVHSPGIIDRIDLTLNENKHPFVQLSTEHLRFQKYEKYCGYTKPQTYEIGTDVIFQIVNRLEIRVQHVKVHGVFMPIVNTLKNFLNIPGLFDEVTTYIKSLENEDEIISNVIQGRLWKTKYKVNQIKEKKYILPIFIFYDDFETGNALGSHKGEQEIGGVYLSLPFLPPHLVAKINHIFAIAVFYTKHRKRFGNQAVCQKVIEEINNLCENGITLENGETVYFQCVLILGDNLGLNCICGFTESFSATRYCRICRATSIECSRMSVEDCRLFRTIENYRNDTQRKSITTGVKEECIFNQLISFHIAQNKTIDIMHDIFEGVAHYTLSKIITCLIYEDKVLSLDDLNKRIAQFYYGEAESNKPRQIYKEYSKPNKNDIVKNKIKIKQSSAEMLCLCRNLGLIIGDLIPGENQYWKLYLILRQIIGIVTAPMFHKADIRQLRCLIKQHNDTYIQLFGPLKPKMHFMVHIPEVMLDNGPLIHIWSMPYERKNRVLKEMAVSTRSHRNVPLTISIRNQLQQCYSRMMCSNVKTLTFIRF